MTAGTSYAPTNGNTEHHSNGERKVALSAPHFAGLLGLYRTRAFQAIDL
jgi:hypothetical protein